MKCSKCGAEIEGYVKFCVKCGGKIDIEAEGIQVLRQPVEQKVEYDNQEIQLLMRPTVSKTTVSKKKENNEGVNTHKEIAVSTDTQINRHLTKNEFLDKKINISMSDFKLFFKVMKDLIKNPLVDRGEMNRKLDTRNTCIYISVLIALNTLMSVIFMEFVLRGLRDFIDVIAYLMSNLNADIHYLTGKLGFSFVIGSLVINIGHVIIFTLLMCFVYSRLIEEKIKWQEVSRYFLAPLSIVIIGKLPVVFITLLSVKLGLLLYLLLIEMSIIVSIISLYKSYREVVGGLYVIIGLYLLSFSINIFMGIKIIMMF